MLMATPKATLVHLRGRIGRWCHRRAVGAFHSLNERFRRWMTEDRS